MPGIPKPPERMLSEEQNNSTTPWGMLQENSAGIKEEVQADPETPVGTDGSTEVTPEPSEPEMYSGPLEKAPLLELGNDLADARIFFSDAVDIAKYAISNGPEAPEEGQPVLLIFGGVCVPVYENSDPEKLEAAWARVMRGHYDKQMEIPGLYGNNSEMKTTYPLVTKTLDNTPEEVLAAEAQADEARRNARDSDIQWADTIIDRENKYEKLKEELQGVEIVFNTENTQPSNVLSDGEKPQRVSPFKKVFKAQRDMHFSWAILWAKLMQQRLNDDETATIKDIAEDTLGILDIKVDAPGPLFSEVTRHLVQRWNRGEELLEWYKEVCER